MQNSKNSLDWAETSAVLYLALPLFVFVAGFVRLWVAIPAGALILYLTCELVCHTAWRSFRVLRWQHLYFLMLAALWIWLSGGIGWVKQNDDWIKHNLIIQILATHPWPVRIHIEAFGDLTLRYYVGWHLIPSLLLEIVPHGSAPAIASVWSMLGVLLLFSLIAELVRRGVAIIAAPVIFVLFGGADFIGTQITQNQMGPEHHLEWWAGWVQFSSNTTALFWSPQQAIPSWLGVALLMRCRGTAGSPLLPYVALFFTATLLWSPFAAIGLVPFLVALAVAHSDSLWVLGWRTVLVALLLTLPIGLYLAAGSGSIPHGFVWSLPCTREPCPSWASYALFIVVEIGLPLSLLLFRRQSEHGFVAVAACALCLIPLYRMGTYNDFAMRVSLPALAVFAILLGKVATVSRPYAIGTGAVLLLALPGVLGEITRGVLARSELPVMDINSSGESMRWWIEQTFTARPIWVLR